MSKFTAKDSISSIQKLLLKELKGKSINGIDSDDNEFSDLHSLWDSELKSSGEKAVMKWYRTAYDFWEDPSKCPVNDDGVLQGYGKLTPMDVRDSNIFLDQLSLKYPLLQFDRVADCGAGIGKYSSL